MEEGSDSSLDLDSFLKAEEDTSKETMGHFKREFEHYRRSFNLLSGIAQWLYNLTEEQPFDSMGKQAVMLIVPRIMQSIQSNTALLLKGYYYDASILQRSFVESIGLCAYLALNEEEATRWFKGKEVKTARIKLPDYVIQLLNVEAKSMRKIYGQLCGYVHTSLKAIASFVTPGPKPRVIVSLTPRFDKERIEYFAIFPTFFLIVLTEIFRNEIPQEDREDALNFLNLYVTEISDVSHPDGPID